MTAEEIRSIAIGKSSYSWEGARTRLLQELVAQLAELNERLRYISSDGFLDVATVRGEPK